jgi:hypothetical protein
MFPGSFSQRSLNFSKEYKYAGNIQADYEVGTVKQQYAKVIHQLNGMVDFMPV